MSARSTNLSNLTSGEVIQRFAPSYTARPESHPIRIYWVKPPDSPFEELGRIKAVVPDTGDEDAITEALTKELEKMARELGGDAIAGLTEFATNDMKFVEHILVAHRRVWRGVVIRYTEPSE